MSPNHELIWIALLLLPVFLIALFRAERKRKRRKEEVSIDQAIESAGYAYDMHQDIFFSRMDAWQKKYGYCQLYDEAAAPLSMIIDCEPIRFTYGDKKWLIEFWKGQYGMTTGCEVGVYYTTGLDLEIPGVFNGTLYDCVAEEDQLYLAFTLRKGSNFLFRREGKHWWLTGFKLGVFSEPDDLAMEVSITLKDQAMRDAFLAELRKTGYTDRELRVFNNTVWIFFTKPHSKQPYTRIEATDNLTQKKNQLLCESYEKLTRGYRLAPDKIRILKQKAPELYEWISQMGKPFKLFRGYEKLLRRP